MGKTYYDTSIYTELAVAVLPIDLQSGQLAHKILNVGLLANNTIRTGFLNNSGYYLFVDLGILLKYNFILNSDYYITYQNLVDLETFDYEKRINPNFEDLLNGNAENDDKYAKSDRTISVFLNNQVSLHEFVKSQTSANTFLIKYITLYPSKNTTLQVILTKLKSNLTNSFVGTNLEDSELPFLNAQVSIQKPLNGSGTNNIIIDSDTINKNSYVFSNLDPHIVSTPVLNSNSILGYRKYVKFDSIPNTDEDVEININIQKNANEMIVSKIRLERFMTTVINILIID